MSPEETEMRDRCSILPTLRQASLPPRNTRCVCKGPSHSPSGWSLGTSVREFISWAVSREAGPITPLPGSGVRVR